MAQQEGRLVHGPGKYYTLRGLPLHEGDPLDILVGKIWASGHLHYEPSDGNWYCEAALMSIPLYEGREARFRLEMLPEPGEEDDLILAALGELGELYEEDAWEAEEFEDEEEI